MQILVAPNAFKNSLSSEEAAEAIRLGFEQSKLACRCECFPIGDGGDGTGDLIIKKCGGELVSLEVSDPLNRKINSSYGLIDNGQTAIIEMASASGLRLLTTDELNPLRATSYGTGEMISAALDKGVSKIVIAMGGSATVDGGCGILSALGIRFLDDKEKDLEVLPESLLHLHRIDVSGADIRISKTEIIVLCDVDNKLLGEDGAAAVFGPQKGASPEGVKQLDLALSRLRELTLVQTGKDIEVLKYGGTAGGAAAGLHAFLNAKLVNGIDHFLDLTGFNLSLQTSDLVITGEGSIDDQTLNGKGPFGVASRARLLNIPVIGLAGKIPLEKSKNMAEFFDVLIAIGHEPSSIDQALTQAAANLTRTSKELGDLIALKW